MRDFAGAAAVVLCYAGYIRSVVLFCRKHLSVSRYCGKIFGPLLFMGGMLCDSVSRRGAASPIAMALSYHILFIGLVLLLFSERAERKVFAAAVLITVTTLMENFCASFLSCLALVYLHGVRRIAEPILGEKESWGIAGAVLIFAALSLSFLSKHFSSILYGKSKKWYLTLSIPLLAAVLLVDLANWGASRGIMVRSGGNMGLYRDQFLGYAGNCVLTAVALLAAGFCVFGMSRIYVEQEKNVHYHMQVAAYRMLEEQYRQSERLRHDLKNHVLVLSEFLEKREWESMERYLQDMRNSADIGSGEEITGNRTVDFLLYQKRRTAEGKNITWECDAQMPPQCRIREFDLCVLFGNLLDNAIEACDRLQRDALYGGRGAFIRIQAVSVRRCLLLEIENSTLAEERQTSDGTVKKRQKEPHGIGLFNVRDVVRRYDGTMKIENAHSVFSVSILIPYPDGDAAYDTEQAV